MNPGHTFTIPAGDQIAAVMRQLWSEQYAVIQQALKMYGRHGLQVVDLDRWTPKLIERLLPLYKQLIVEGKVSFASHVTKQKHYRMKRGAGVELIHGIPVSLGGRGVLAPTAEVNEYIEVVDPNVEELARSYLYDFAASTLATSKLSVLEAYQATQNVLGSGLGAGDTLAQTTQALGQIFHDPDRASMIAQSESSRLYHAGQLITAEESGEIHGKVWLASTDACPSCLELNGKSVPLDEPFVDEPGRYGRVMHPPRHPRCQCSLTYELLPVAQQAQATSSQQPEQPGVLSWVPGQWQVLLGRQAA